MVPVDITIVTYFSSPRNCIMLTACFFVGISQHSFLVTSLLPMVHPVSYFKADSLDSSLYIRPTFFFQSKLKSFAHFPASWECEDWLKIRKAEIACHFYLPPATTVFITETGSPDH